MTVTKLLTCHLGIWYAICKGGEREGEREEEAQGREKARAWGLLFLGREEGRGRKQAEEEADRKGLGLAAKTKRKGGSRSPLP